jgi:iron complex transport system ATP-binding protein
MSALLVARDLTIQGRLEPLSLQAGAGQLVGLIGPNGSGKTSLLHALAAIPPSSGEAAIGGEAVRAADTNRRQKLFSFLPASRDVTWPLLARDFIALALPPNSAWVGLAERLELAPLLDRRMDQLSTGERTRIMIARALAPNPELMLLDEPIANLDPYWQLQILGELKERAHSGGKAIIMAIHDLKAALEWSDRILLMDAGKLAADGSPGELLKSGVIEKIFRVSLTEPRQAGRRSSP